MNHQKNHLRAMPIQRVVRNCWPIDASRLSFLMQIDKATASTILQQACRAGTIRRISRGIYGRNNK